MFGSQTCSARQPPVHRRKRDGRVLSVHGVDFNWSKNYDDAKVAIILFSINFGATLPLEMPRQTMPLIDAKYRCAAASEENIGG